MKEVTISTPKLRKKPLAVKHKTKPKAKNFPSVLKYTLKQNVLFLAIYTFVFLVAVNILLNESATENKRHTTSPTTQVLAAYNIQTEIRPLLINDHDLAFPIISAQGVLVIDFDSGEQLYAKNSDKLLLPASTVKIMTALITLENMQGEKSITVGEVDVDGQKMNLYEGQEINVDNLVKALLVYSANDAAEVLASNYAGGREAFVNDMNSKIKDLGLSDTIYTNPTGIDGTSQVTSAHDLIALSKYALTNPKFAEIVNKENVQIYNANGELFRTLHTTNDLLGKVEGVQGVKTGWTKNARENLVTYVDRKGRKILIAVLGSQDRFGETKELITWVYDNYEWVEVPVVDDEHSLQ
ncbi:D-alanyl-D-alanine carboxypeptidase [Candidatus Woesebacteria bacterium]|nr:MAG: D-alanyl-D-alanine carboxypeptidase [Candidatus Woesebacteria bacterium]